MTTSTNQKKETWSHATKEVLDTLPKPWTRGLLYFLISFITLVLPWAILSKVDETGTARGKLEPKGDTVKIDSVVSGKVEKIYVQEGEFIKLGQLILTIDSQLVQAELQQVQEKLIGQKSRLYQLELLRKQLDISLLIQQQQNQSQELEKQAQLEQAKQSLKILKNNYELQKSEKLAQVNQAKIALEKSQTDSPILKSRYQVALKEINRYNQAFQEGVISEVQVVEKEDNAKEIQRFYEQSKAEIKQNQQRLTELQSIYQQTVQQAKANIEQAQLKVWEQQRSYQSLKHSNQLSLLKIKEQLRNLETEMITLKAEIAQLQSQIKSLQIQLTQRSLKANTNGLIFQLPIKKAGAVVQSGTRIAEIAPKGSRLILRSQMPTDQSGSMKTGLPVKLKFDAYPFQDYGIVEGKLIKISPTTTEIDTLNSKVTAYQLEIELSRTCVAKGNQCIALHPGDTATAEVIVRQRRVIDFVLDPFKRLGKEGLKL